MVNHMVLLVQLRSSHKDGFCSSVVEYWSSNPEDVGSIPWSCIFRNWRDQLGLIIYMLTTLEFPTHNLTTSAQILLYIYKKIPLLLGALHSSVFKTSNVFNKEFYDENLKLGFM